MKLIAFMLLTALTQVSAKSFSQTVTLRENKISIEQALKSIADQSGYYFLYDRKDIPKYERIDVNLTGVSVDEALNQCFKNQPLSYKIIQQTIVVKRKAAVPAVKAQLIKVSGKVTDNAGLPLPGVSVKVKGVNIGAVTDANGGFILNGVDENSTLIFTYIGFTQQEIAVGGRTVINVILKEEASNLNEVVVVGYGTQKKESLTGAISTINGDDLTDRPVTSVATALQGLAAGLTVTRETGQPGEEGINIQVRGATSANDGVDVLVVVDGVTAPSITLQTMNPNDIESISVLKDAAAAAIYGAQSAGGVILITTKKGKAGKTIFDYSNNIGTEWGINIPKRLSLLDEALYSNLSRKNAGQGPEYSDLDLEYIMNNVPYRDHPTDPNAYIYYNQESLSDQLLKNTTTTQTHNFNVRGGTEKFKFLLGLGYYDKEGIFKVGPDENARYNLRLNTETQLNKFLSFDSRLNYTKQTIQAASTLLNGNNADGGVFYEIYRLRTRTPFFTPEGRYNNAAPKAYAAVESGGYNNIDRNYFDGVFNLKAANFIKGLQLRAVYGTQRRYSDRDRFERTVLGWNKNNSSAFVNPTNLFRVTNEAITTNNIQGLADYDLKVGSKHKFHFLGGYQFEDYRSSNLTSQVQSLLNNDVPALSLGDEKSKTANETIRTYAYQSVFGRLNYSYADKYLFETTVRTDESTRLAPGIRVKTFPSLSAGWNMHMEPWFKSFLPFFSQFKVRGSWGNLGNAQGIGNYDYLNLLERRTDLVLGDVRSTYVLQNEIPSQDLSWETIETLNGGIDFGFLKSKLQGSFDYYVKQNHDMLLRIELPDVLGVTAPRKNVAGLRTWGWELDLKYNNTIGRNFKYNVGLNLSDNKNKLTSFEGGTVVRAGSNRTIEGYSLNSFFGYETNGYYTSSEEYTNEGVVKFAKTGAGDVRYVDQNGDNLITIGKGTSADYGDLKFLGTTNPRYLFGINLGMAWKGIDLSTFFQGVGKRNFMPTQRSLNSQFVSWMQALQVHQDYWTEENQDALFPRPYAGSDHNYNPSDKWFLNGQYIRLKNIQLGYSLPNKLISKAKITRARIFFTGQDLLTFSKLGKFKGYYDPEMRDNLENDYPFFATAALGLNLTF